MTLYRIRQVWRHKRSLKCQSRLNSINVINISLQKDSIDYVLQCICDCHDDKLVKQQRFGKCSGERSYEYQELTVT